MAEAISHTAAAVALSGAGAGTISTMLGLDPGALFWAFFGALCSRAIQPRITSLPEIIQAGGYGAISTVLGTLGSVFSAPAIVTVLPSLAVVDRQTMIALPAFLLGVLGHEIIIRVVGMIREFRSGGVQ